MILASLPACANWQQLAAGNGKIESLVVTPADTKRDLPEIPASLKACFDKMPCLAKPGVKALDPSCKTADGLVLEQFKALAEKTTCGKAFVNWYNQVRAAEAGAQMPFEGKKSAKSPGSARASTTEEKPSWP